MPPTATKRGLSDCMGRSRGGNGFDIEEYKVVQARWSFLVNQARLLEKARLDL